MSHSEHPEIIQPEKPHVVIIGGGFGGLEAARNLRRVDVRVTLVDRHNYHLFQPLLYQVATGGLSPANIAAPLRTVLRKQRNCEVLLAEVTDIDVANRQVILADGRLGYDYLIVAAGSTHSYFGHEKWQRYAPGLKTVEDALEIRRRIFLSFEAAEREVDPDVRRALMTFVVVGGGPTGVELAGAMAEIARHAVKGEFRHIDPRDARILLIEAAPRVLAHFPEKLSQRASEKLSAMGVTVLVNTKVVELAEDCVHLDTGQDQVVIDAHTVLWAAGVQANPLGRIIASRCNVSVDRSGRVPVTPRLHVEGHEEVFVIGDLALCPAPTGEPLPGLAPVAMQQGEYVARLISARVSNRQFTKGFQYVDRGVMATIGRAAAVARIGKRQFHGVFAWLLWLAVHLLQIIRFENRLLILIQWAWYYILFNPGARIITGIEHVVLVGRKKQTNHPQPGPDNQ